MTGEALIVMEGIDAEKGAEDDSPAPDAFRAWQESDFSGMAAFEQLE